MERNQVLQNYTGWLHTVARGMTDGSLHDDLVQEGYVAMWRALKSHDPDQSSQDFWLKRSATDRMRSVVTGARMTSALDRASAKGFTTSQGNETRKRIADYINQHPTATGIEIAKAIGISNGTLSYQRKKMGTVATASVLSRETVSLEAMSESGWDLEGPDYLDSIEVSYHAGEIYDALDALTPTQRKYVMARFWGGMDTSELKELFGYDPTSLWRDAKPRLQNQLDYLRELVTT